MSKTNVYQKIVLKRVAIPNFTSLIQLKLELFDYINWYNNIRIHSTLNYLTPVNYQKQMSTKK
ncbi:IS3 family transposase [Spiroplasma endosymbiont of Apeira syringaria]|uniref:IS3 family transposase n=1 Tax=Spiroplasma endosymbiont of Apeira syringaria TaxID=3066307 RepID=UPI003BAFF1C6